jgi:hypothetical protein
MSSSEIENQLDDFNHNENEMDDFNEIEYIEELDSIYYTYNSIVNYCRYNNIPLCDYLSVDKLIDFLYNL